MNLWKRFRLWLDRESHLATLHTWNGDLRTPAERTADLMGRLQFARDEMKRRGSLTLLDGKPAWQRINPMSAEAPRSKVVRMRGRK